MKNRLVLNYLLKKKFRKLDYYLSRENIFDSSNDFDLQLFRCAIVCVLFGALGKNGQNLLTIIVFNNLSTGPVENIIKNFKISTDMVTCHIKQKEDMMTQRVVMATGPIEAFMAKQFGKFLLPHLGLLKTPTAHLHKKCLKPMNGTSR